MKTLKNFSDVKCMTNYLPFETYPRVLAQFLQKCQAIKDSYFQVQKNVKNMKKIWSEITYVFEKMWCQIVQLS